MIHFKQNIKAETQRIKEWVCIKCDYTTDGETVFKKSMEIQKPMCCPKCDVELVGRIQNA